MESIAAIDLCVVARLVRLAQQRGGFDASTANHRETDAATNRQGTAGHREWDVLDQPHERGAHAGGLTFVHAMQVHDELVSAEASDDVTRANCGDEPFGSAPQKRVAARMTNGVVDVPELIQVDEQESVPIPELSRQLHFRL